MADQAMEKLANELIERLGVVETENKTLRKTNEDLRTLVAQQAQSVKTASEQIKQVDDGLLDTTCQNLVKCGALRQDQVDQAKVFFKTDMNASLRVIQSLLDERAQVKTASTQESLRGGRLVKNPQNESTPEEACLERMYSILGLH